jgi:hypothetical protein
LLLKFSIKGLACILPAVSGDVILLPASSTEWIINQPDEILNVKQAHMDGLQSDYTFSDPAVVRQPHHEHVIKTDLLRQLSSLTMDIMDELTTGFDETWGLETENWKSIGVFANMMAIIARTSNRIFIGLPLCMSNDCPAKCVYVPNVFARRPQ